MSAQVHTFCCHTIFHCFASFQNGTTRAKTTSHVYLTFHVFFLCTSRLYLTSRDIRSSCVEFRPMSYNFSLLCIVVLFMEMTNIMSHDHTCDTCCVFDEFWIHCVIHIDYISLHTSTTSSHEFRQCCVATYVGTSHGTTTAMSRLISHPCIHGYRLKVIFYHVSRISITL